MIIDCIADLHGHYPNLEGGDLLIVAGDLTARDIDVEYFEVFNWISKQNYKKKIVIAGNHDNRISNHINFPNHFEYLCDSGTEFQGLKIWGSPWTKTFEGMNPHCKAFTCDTEEELADKWKAIPEDTDILICHSPMWGLHDTNLEGMRCGSTSLLQHHVKHTIKNLSLFVCGHIHEGYGVYDVRAIQLELGDPIGCVHVNASHVDVYYRPVNKPIRVIL